MSFNNQGSQPSSSQPYMQSEYKTMWQTNEPIDVDSYQPIQSGPLPVITKVESMSRETPEADAQILKHVCNALGLDSNLSMQKIREEIRKKHKPGLLCHPNLKSPKTTACKAIFISQLPLWFEFNHVKTLIQLKSDFDVNWGSYYIDMFKNVKNKNTGECLLRFIENKDCIQVFKDLQGIVFSNGPIIVNLDLDHEIANVRDRFHPNFEEMCGNFNGSGQNIIVKTEMNSNDDLQLVEPNNIKIEMPENINTSSGIKQESGDDLNTSEIIKKEEGVIDMDIEENSPTVPTQKNTTEENKRHLEEQYQKCVQRIQGIQACRIVHIKNLDPSKKGFYHPTIKDFITKTMGKKVNFQYRRVIDDKQDASGDVLLNFTSHGNAASFCRMVNTSKDNPNKFQELKYLVAPNAKIEAIMGVGYTFKSPVTTTDLRLYQLKRKLMDASNGEQENSDVKKAKVDASTTKDDSKTGKEQSQSSSYANDRSNDQRSTSANDRSNDQRSISTNERSNDQRASTNDRSNDQRSTSTNERSNDQRASTNERSYDQRASTNERSNDQRASTSGNERSNDRRSSSANERSNDQRSSTSASEETKDRRASSRANGETNNREKTSRASDYETGVMIVDEREFSAFGLSKEFIRSHSLRVPFSRTVVVSHLHPDVNEAKLMEVFSLAGEVKKIDYNNRSRNVAKIEFDHSLDAVQAISMFDKQKLYNKPMMVEMDELPRRRTLPEGLAGVGPGLGKGGQILRGCRVQAEVRRLYEHFVDLGTMEREREEQDNNTAFKFKFNPIKPKDRKAAAKTCECCRDTSALRESSKESKSSNKPSSSDSRNKSSSNSNKPNNSNTQSTSKSESSFKDSSKGKSEENIPQGTLLAIQALGTVLVAQGLIPANTNCKSLQSILGALQLNTAAQQNLQNTNVPSMNPAVPNPGLVTVIPNRNDVLNQALNNVMQFMSSSVTPQQANVAPNIQNVAPVPAIPAPVPPRPVAPPVANIHQGNVQPVAPYANPRFPSMPAPVTPVAPPIPAPVKPAVPRAAFATPVRPANAPPPPQTKIVQPAYDQYRTNLRAVPTIPSQKIPPQKIPPQQIPPRQIPPQQIPPKQIPPRQIPPQQIPPRQIPPQQIKPQQSTSQQKPETVQKKPDSASHTKTTLDKEYSQSKENLKNSKMLVFKDLPACVTAEILQGKMNEVGEVKFCEMTGRGRAFVRFSNPQDADRCIQYMFSPPLVFNKHLLKPFRCLIVRGSNGRPDVLISCYCDSTFVTLFAPAEKLHLQKEEC